MTEDSVDTMIDTLNNIIELCRRMKRNARRGSLITLNSNVEMLLDDINAVQRIMEEL